jgi:hypothetical protein
VDNWSGGVWNDEIGLDSGGPVCASSLQQGKQQQYSLDFHIEDNLVTETGILMENVGSNPL